MKRSPLTAIVICFLLVLLGILSGCGAPSLPAPAEVPTPTPEPPPTKTPPLKPAPSPTQTPTPEETPTPTPEAEIPIIDAHSQVGTFSESGVYWDLNKIMQLIDEAGVARTILMARGTVTPEELVSFASDYPGRIIPAVRITSALYSNNDAGYYTFLRKQVNMHQFGAMGEVLMYHAPKPAAKGRSVPETVVYPDDERVQAALEYAIEKKWPFMVHNEFGSTGCPRDEFMTKLKALLLRHPEHPFVLAAMGQLNYVDVRQLIEAHPNIHFTTSHSDPFIVRDAIQPWTNMFDGNRLSADWKQLMTDHPDRFILAFDNVQIEGWGQYYLKLVTLWRDAIKELPVKVAHAFAHGNAERLWRLPPAPS